MEKLLVVGASGLLGRRLVEIGKGAYEVYGVDLSHVVDAKNFSLLDVTHRDAVISTVKKIDPDLIIDTHALTDLDYCETHHEEAWRVNVEGTKNVAEAANEICSKYVFISTDYVYDGESAQPYTEDAAVRPLSYYAKTKLIAESAASVLCKDFLIARTAVLFGPSSMSYSGKVPFPAWVVAELGKGKEIRVVTDQCSNPTYADSLAEFLFALSSKGAKGVFNVSGKDNMSRYDFALKIAQVFGLDQQLIKPIKTSELSQVAQRSKRVILDISKAEKASGIEGLPIDEALRLSKVS